MAKVRQEHIDALKAAKLWPDFVVYREQLIADGATRESAGRQALKKFLVGEVAERVGKKMSLPECATPSVASASVEPPRFIGTPENDFVDCGDDMLGAVPKAPAPVPLSAFDGKSESDEIENIRWVMENMRTRNLTAATCPSKTAWGLLCECRENAEFRLSFFKDYYAKTIIKPKEEKQDDGEIDGAVQVELIGKILRLRDSAVAERQTHTLKAVGSNPTPATNLQVAV